MHTLGYITPLNGHQEAFIQRPVHPVDRLSPPALGAPLCDLCVSALVDSCPGPAPLRSTLMSNPILTVSSFSPRSRSASHEYPKVCLLDRIIPPAPLSKPLGTILQPQKNTLNGSSSLPLCFSASPLLPHSRLSLSIEAFTKHIDPPDPAVHLPLFIGYWAHRETQLLLLSTEMHPGQCLMVQTTQRLHFAK